MANTLRVGDVFPDVELPDQRNLPARLSQLTRASLLDEHLGFADGYPLIVQFFRGFFCPRDQEQMRQLVQFQRELAVNYSQLVSISADPPIVNAAFRAGLGAEWPFLSDVERAVIKQLDILDETEGEYAYRAQPYTFVLRPDLRIHAIYNGWFFVGRPTLEELRHDLRAIMQLRADYRYEAYATPAVRQVRIPQQEWANGAPALGASGLPVARGVVRWFDSAKGVGMIAPDIAPDAADASQTMDGRQINEDACEANQDRDGDVFFHFTAIPGEGYRTVRAGAPVQFEVVQTSAGKAARNVQPLAQPDSGKQTKPRSRRGGRGKAITGRSS
jgi:cold shock CspA family protein/peroxiredoxin